MNKHIAILGIAATLLQAQAPREEPVGLVLSAGGAKVLRATTETPLGARSGDIAERRDGAPRGKPQLRGLGA